MSQNIALPQCSIPKVLSILYPSEPTWFAATQQTQPAAPPGICAASTGAMSLAPALSLLQLLCQFPIESSKKAHHGTLPCPHGAPHPCQTHCNQTYKRDYIWHTVIAQQMPSIVSMNNLINAAPSSECYISDLKCACQLSPIYFSQKSLTFWKEQPINLSHSTTPNLKEKNSKRGMAMPRKSGNCFPLEGMQRAWRSVCPFLSEAAGPTAVILLSKITALFNSTVLAMHSNSLDRKRGWQRKSR